MNDREKHEYAQKHPHPGTDPVARLRHTLDVFGPDVNDDEFVVRATGGIYSDGETTGLTWGDLKALAALIGA